MRDGTPDQRDAGEGGSITREVSGRKVIAAVDHEVEVGEQFEGRGRRESFRHGDDRRFWIEGRDGQDSGGDLAATHIGHAVDELAVKVAQLDRVIIDDADGSDTGRREGGNHAAAEAASADHEHSGCREPGLLVGSEAGQRELARIAEIHGSILAPALPHPASDRIHGSNTMELTRIRKKDGMAATKFTVIEAAALLGVSDDTVRRWAEASRLTLVSGANGRSLVDGLELAGLAQELANESALVAAFPRSRASARNRITGIVTRVVKDGVMAQVELQAGPFRIVSLMSREAADELQLEPGTLATASVKATTVVVELPEAHR